MLPGNKENFPDEFKSGTRLQYYSTLFNSLEINSSFYKTPQPQTFSKWEHEVNNDFRFTVKMSRDITHSKKLDFHPEDLEKFMDAARHIESKKGALLIQFPASITADYCFKIEDLIKQTQSLQGASKWDIAIEVRHNSWHNMATYNMLTRHGASMVFHDMPTSKTPLDQSATNIIYIRFHGAAGDYKGSYRIDDMEKYIELIIHSYKIGKTIFVYFNNIIGNAYENALSLQHYIREHIG
ncbi:DUF72 domain-containing protein [Cellvibrio mixtus]|uniref:DUF72 domain-containing protein n=1 Tax=Cellvibrio mixtus TaxID=39650 RepID=UPI000693C456|nr:DUF72 domain-containing protein [Cellvibrio mixtus]